MKSGWSRNCAILGAVAWTALCAYAGTGKAPLGAIELLVLFAALVVVPLGLTLGDMILPASPSGLLPHVARLQPFAAAALTISFWISPGPYAALLALPWAVVCLSLAFVGVRSLWSARTLPALALNIGRMDLAVAAAWLLASRLGFRPLGFQEPIVLLTGVHFHFTGFASAHILAAVLTMAGNRARMLALLKWMASLVLLVPFLLAVGFVLSPWLKMVAAMALVVGMTGLALVQLLLAGSTSSRVSRAYLWVSSLSVAAGMGVAAVYAVGDWLGRDWLVIPQVAGTHGVLNALGFSLCGLLGWLVELAPASADAIAHAYFEADARTRQGISNHVLL